MSHKNLVLTTFGADVFANDCGDQVFIMQETDGQTTILGAGNNENEAWLDAATVVQPVG